VKILVDSNVLLDIFTEDERWFDWSSEKIEYHAERDILGINPIIYAEVSVHQQLKNLIRPCRRRKCFVGRFLGPPDFWPGVALQTIESEVVIAGHPCLISTSALMPASSRWSC